MNEENFEMSTDENRNQFGSSANYLDYVLLHQLAEFAPKRIVDFGAGEGKNGKLIRSVFKNDCEIIAVEGYEPTANMLKTAGIYDEVHHSLIQKWLQENTKQYDLAVFGDVLEHLTSREIHQAVKTALTCFERIIIVVPLYDLYQDEMYGNPLEIHKSFITGKCFDRYHPLEKHIRVGRNETGEGYTIMNVFITRKRRRESFLRRLELGVIRFWVPLLEPIGLGRAFISFLQFVKKRILNR